MSARCWRARTRRARPTSTRCSASAAATAATTLYDQAVAIVAKDRKCSTSYIQRKLGIGYNKAARLVEQMEDQGVVTPANHVGKREILVPEV
jgi:DNA segregation ATPase FtsK/SpoIIIE, S-DNA-T family